MCNISFVTRSFRGFDQARLRVNAPANNQGNPKYVVETPSGRIYQPMVQIHQTNIFVAKPGGCPVGLRTTIKRAQLCTAKF
jgi:hypothetical protein